MGSGGVIDQDGKFIDSSGLYMNWISFGGKYDFNADDVKHENKNVIWFGFLQTLGAFSSGFLSRMWYLLEQYNGEDIIYVSHDQTIDSNYILFF